MLHNFGASVLRHPLYLEGYSPRRLNTSRFFKPVQRYLRWHAAPEPWYLSASTPSVPQELYPLALRHLEAEIASAGQTLDKSPSRDRKRARNADQARDIAELKGQMAQILKHLSRQQVPPAPAPASPAPAPEHTPASPVVATEVEQQDVVMSEEEQDAISLGASWDEESLQTETQNPDLTQVMAASSELASEPEIPAPSNSVRALMERAANFLQVPWKASSEQRRSVFEPAQTSTPRPFPAFPDFLEEVKSSWQHPASAPSVSKSTAALASMEGAEFPLVDSIIAALV
ncbi:UNVERIFIED_CONTAM: hypothetical protein FKN15_039737 [Acipenser sinensis]